MEPEPATLLRDAPSLPLPADRAPLKVYLGTLQPTGRRSMRTGLERVARILSSGALGADDLPWQAVRYQHLAAVRQALVGEGLAPASVNLYLASVRGVMRQAWLLGYITADDYQRLGEVKPVRGERLVRGRAVSTGELRAIFDALAADPSVTARRDACALAVLYSSAGIRRAEAVALDLEDLIREGDDYSLRIRDGKGGRQRVVPITNGALTAILDWLSVRSDRPGALLLPVTRERQLDYAGRLGPEVLWKVCQRRAKQANVQPLSPHDLRRSSISDLLDATGDALLVAALAGHAGVGTVARYDRRPAAARRRAAAHLHLPYRPPAEVS